MSASGQARVTSVDVLRGVIMVLMALDHTRDYIHYAIDPTDLTQTTTALFFTRWVTHFCAPVFMLLAGTGAYLQLSRGKTRGELSRFLVTRGLWLVVLEVTVVRCLGWFWNFDYHLVLLIVIWALGWSMIALAGLIWIPRRLLLVVCLVGIAGHNLLDGYEPAGRFGWLWNLLHVPGALEPASGVIVGVGYALVPWIFVMGLGFCLGPVFGWEPAPRRRALLWSGALVTVAFVALRALGGYGDPQAWIHGQGLLGFLNCEKYPPSLDYLLMTLGPALLVLGSIETWRDRVSRIFLVFGRVPMFYYLLHIPAIHLAALGLALVRYGGHAGFLFQNPTGDAFFETPPGYGYPLSVVYVVWIGVVAALYPLCRWFAEYKRTHRAAWLSYV